MGLKNRQLISSGVKKVIDPVAGVGKKTALWARYTYQHFFDETPTHITNVRITNLTPTSATVQWNTNHITRSSKINYGTGSGGAYTQEMFEDDPVTTDHSITVTNLLPNTTYYFEVMNQNGDYVYDAYYTLTTLEEGEDTDESSIFIPKDVLITSDTDIYEESDEESEVIESVKEGDRYRALTKAGEEWISILLPSRKEGWVSMENVEIVEQQQPSAKAQKSTLGD